MEPARVPIDRESQAASVRRRALALWFGLEAEALATLPEEVVAVMTARVTGEWPCLGPGDVGDDPRPELRAHLAERLRHLSDAARTDVLTGLANRRALQERLDAELSRTVRCGEPLTVLLADVDDLKGVNDSDGHNAGDTLLCEVAARLDGAVRRSDLVGRWGGDEFMVLCPGVDENVAPRLCAKLRCVVEERPLHLHCGSVPVRVSFGWAVGRPRQGLLKVVERADASLYCAKAQRRNALLDRAGS